MPPWDIVYFRILRKKLAIFLNIKNNNVKVHTQFFSKKYDLKIFSSHFTSHFIF
jgi:hypothetical protein